MVGQSTFRIINKADVVPRMPPRSNPGSIVYDHFGWTILITEVRACVRVLTGGRMHHPLRKCVCTHTGARPPPPPPPPSLSAPSHLSHKTQMNT